MLETVLSKLVSVNRIAKNSKKTSKGKLKKN